MDESKAMKRMSEGVISNEENQQVSPVQMSLKVKPFICNLIISLSGSSLFCETNFNKIKSQTGLLSHDLFLSRFSKTFDNSVILYYTVAKAKQFSIY